MLADKEKMELLNLRTRVVNQKMEIKRLTEQVEQLKAERQIMINEIQLLNQYYPI